MGMYFDENGTAENKFQSIDSALNGLCDRIDVIEAKLGVLLNAMNSISSNLQKMSLAINASLSELSTVPVNPVAVEPTVESVSVYKENTKNEETNHAIVLEIRYLGAPSGAGFEVMNERAEKTVNTLYVLEIDRSAKTARFYPDKAKISQLAYNRTSLLDPVCEIDGVGDLSSCDISIIEEDYGLLCLDIDYWKVTKKCKLRC